MKYVKWIRTKAKSLQSSSPGKLFNPLPYDKFQAIFQTERVCRREI